MVHEIREGDSGVSTGPGIWLMPHERQYGLKPERGPGGRELVPFAWATEFEPLGEFILRFPDHWKADPVAEVWHGGPYQPNGVYWVRYNPSRLTKGT